MKAKKRSALLAAALTVVTCVVLTGCTPKSLMAIRGTEDGFEIMACEALSTQALEVWTSPADRKPLDYSVVWRAVGDIDVSAGDVVQYGANPPGMVTEVEPVPVDPSNRIIAVSFEHIDSSGELEKEVQAHFNGADLSTSNWLDESGGVSTSPCG